MITANRPTIIATFNSVESMTSFGALAAKVALASIVLGTFSTLPAQAIPPSSIIRYSLSYTTTSGVGSLAGYMDIDTSIAPTSFTQNLFSDPSITSWFKNLSLTYNNGTTSTTYTSSDFNVLTWAPPFSGIVDWNSSLLNQFDTIGFGLDDINYPSQTAPLFAVTGGFGFLESDGNGNDYLLSSAAPPVPAPLPILGVGSAFAYSRRLRNRQRLALKSLEKPQIET